MQIFLSIKFHVDQQNRPLIEYIDQKSREIGHRLVCICKDVERWGDVSLEPGELMETTFLEIDKSELVLVEFSEKGVGIGIEAGYAYSKKKPIIAIGLRQADLPNTLRGITDRVIRYDSREQLGKIIQSLLQEL